MGVGRGREVSGNDCWKGGEAGRILGLEKIQNNTLPDLLEYMADAPLLLTAPIIWRDRTCSGLGAKRFVARQDVSWGATDVPLTAF